MLVKTKRVETKIVQILLVETTLVETIGGRKIGGNFPHLHLLVSISRICLSENLLKTVLVKPL